MTEKVELGKLLSFVKFTHKFNRIKRGQYVTGEDRNENDSEHSYQLALVAWYLIDSKKLKLSLNKVIKYALVHDLVEIYAGDVYFHTKDKKLKEEKKNKENKAAKRIKKEYPEFSNLYKLLNEYEKRVSREARFVYALDKVLPVMNIYLDKGRSWKREGVTYEMVRTKDEKVKISKGIDEIWKNLCKLLEKENSNLFPT